MTKLKEWSDDIGQLIISHWQDGRTEREIAAMAKVPKSTVHDVIMKKRITGGVRNRPRSGRNRATSVHDDRRIRRIVLSNRRVSVMRLAKEMIDELNVKVTPQTIRNRLYEIGLHGRAAQRKLLIRKPNRVKRSRWANSRKVQSNAYWKEII